MNVVKRFSFLMIIVLGTFVAMNTAGMTKMVHLSVIKTDSMPILIIIMMTVLNFAFGFISYVFRTDRDVNVALWLLVIAIGFFIGVNLEMGSRMKDIYHLGSIQLVIGGILAIANFTIGWILISLLAKRLASRKENEG